MGRKAKNKNRKGRASSAASAGPSADAELQRRESEASEAVASSGASSLVGDEDERPSIAESLGAAADAQELAADELAADERATDEGPPSAVGTAVEIEAVPVDAEAPATSSGGTERQGELEIASTAVETLVVDTADASEDKEQAAAKSADVAIERAVQGSEATVDEHSVLEVDAAASVEVFGSDEPSSEAAVEPGVVVEQLETEKLAVSEAVATEEREETAVWTEEIAVEQQSTVVAESERFTVEEHRTETAAAAEDGVVGVASAADDEELPSETVEQRLGLEAPTIATEEVAVEQQYAEVTEAQSVTVEDRQTEAVAAQDEVTDAETASVDGEEHITETDDGEKEVLEQQTETAAAEVDLVGSVAAEDASVEENYVAEEVAVDQVQIEAAVAEAETIEERHHQEIVEEVAVDEIWIETAVVEDETVEVSHHQEIVEEDVAVDEVQIKTAVVQDETVGERRHEEVVATEVAVDEVQIETAVVEDETIEERHHEEIMVEKVDEVHIEAAVAADDHIQEEPHEQSIEVSKEDIVVEEVAVDEVQIETAVAVLAGSETIEERHHEEFVSEEEVIVDEVQIETAVAEDEHIQVETHEQSIEVVKEELVVEESHTETVVIDRSTEQQSSHTDVTAPAVEAVAVNDGVESPASSLGLDSAAVDYRSTNAQPGSTEPASNTSMGSKTRPRPMLTTERSFVMEDDDTVKADDTVVVSERVSTDGEDDVEELATHNTEGFQAAAIANSMSTMRPVVDKHHAEESLAKEQNGKSRRSSSSATVPTATSSARRSSEDATPNVTPTRVRSRSRSNSRQSTPDTGVAKPSPVPVPSKRASIMAPTASYAAKHQTSDAPTKTLARRRSQSSQSSESKPEISDTGFVKPPPAPPTVPVAPKRASIMAPTASYAAKHQTGDPPKKTHARVRSDKHAKPEVSDTGFVKPPPAPSTVPVPPKRASIMAPTASSAAKRGNGDAADASVESKVSPRPRRSLGKPEVSDTGFVKPPPAPPTVPIAPKRASLMAPTASSAAKRGGPDASADEWSRDAPPKLAARTKAAEFVPTVPVAPKRASIMAPTASFRAKSGPEVVIEALPPPPVETKPLYRNKRYANVQSKVLSSLSAPANKPAERRPVPPPVEEPAPAQKPTVFRSKRYANVQSKIKDMMNAGPSQPDPSAVERRRSLGGAKRGTTTAADAAARRRSSLAANSTLRGATVSGSGSGSDSSDPFAQALAARALKKKLSNAVPRYLSYESSGVYAQRAQTQQDRRRRLEEANKGKSQTRQQQLRVLFAEKLHVNYSAQEAEHSQAALGNVGARAKRSGGKAKAASSLSSSASDELSEPKAARVAIAGGVVVLPATETAAETVAETVAEAVEPTAKLDDGVTKKINFDETSDDEEDEEASTVAAAATAVPVADVA